MERIQQLNIGLIGCGTVGRGVVDLIAEQSRKIEKRFGVRLKLVRIVNRSRVKLSAHVRRELHTTVSNRLNDCLKDPSIECVVELIGGTTVARRVIQDALAHGKHVVTANKALLAEHGEELFRAARRASRHIFFEASVAGGIPILKVLLEGLAANRVRSISAILNGTSNFILTRMSRDGRSFKDALQEAQSNGFAEKNPFLDVMGFDTRHKLAILATLAFGQRIHPKLILCEGIDGLDETDIRAAHELGYEIKPIAIARLAGGELDIRVHPALLGVDHLLASVNGVYNAIVLTGDRVGETVYTGEGAGQRPTASSVVADLIDCALGTSRPVAAQQSFLTPLKLRIRDTGRIASAYYLRFEVRDRPGVLARISGILGRQHVSVAQVIQKGRGRKGTVPLILLTHEAREENLRSAFREITRLKVVKGPGVKLRVEG